MVPTGIAGLIWQIRVAFSYARMILKSREELTRTLEH